MNEVERSRGHDLERNLFAFRHAQQKGCILSLEEAALFTPRVLSWSVLVCLSL